ncbi:MAG TPA: alpha/beta hydrolase [Acidimicrobiales bacterium]|nr:alpha/beta hydrolase [Acidimicrobiales bacterium]
MQMKLWDVEMEAAREAIKAEAKEFVSRFPDGDPGTGSPQARAEAMRQAESALVLRSEKAVDRVVHSPSGPLRLREFRPQHADADGAMLHIHGGGWMTGEPALTDLLHEPLSDHLHLAIVSVDYRLAPEHPYPAGPDDCEAAALWLIEQAANEYGTDRLLIGGESAGAHLSALTLLRLRDRHAVADRFCGANLVFGAYDLSTTPSAAGVGLTPGTDLLDPEKMAFMAGQFLPGLTTEQCRSPDISPLYADLRGLPPALFTVGTADHLVDDSLFFAQRWLLAGNSAELLVYPDAPHGCIGLPTVLGHWWPRLEAFLTRCLQGTVAG